MKCHILLSEKNKKNISKCCLLKILPRVLSVNSSSLSVTNHHAFTQKLHNTFILKEADILSMNFVMLSML